MQKSSVALCSSRGLAQPLKMGEPSSQEHGSEELGRSVSVMRSFLDSKEELVFTDENRRCGPIKNHCEIGTTGDFPFNSSNIF